MHNYEHEIEMPQSPAIEKFLWWDYFHDSVITSVEQVKMPYNYGYSKPCDYLVTLQCDRDACAHWERNKKKRAFFP